MFRRLITLLALLTGLAAVGAPAQAAIYDGNAGVELTSDSQRCGAEVTSVLAATADGNRRRPAVRSVWQPCTQSQVAIPTVRIGVDRASE